MSPSPILSTVHSVTIHPMLNFNGGSNGHELKNVTCKRTLKIRERNREKNESVNHPTFTTSTTELICQMCQIF